LNGRSVVVTGKIAGESRASATAKLAAAGAHVQSSVTKATDVLVIGADVGRVKTDKAAALGVPTITWGDAVALMRGAVAVPATAPPSAAPTRNQPVPAQAGYRQVLPMLCKKADALPSSGEWLYEVKWDGYRCVAHVNGSTILASRKGKDFARFEHIVAELDQLTVPCILDGEIVSLDEEGRSAFHRLHSGEEEAAKFVVFDVLEAMGTDIRNQPLTERKSLLSGILEGGVYVTESPVFDDGEELLAYALENELEGIVAKPPNSVYKENSRAAWLKLKLRVEGEFVVVGYTDGKGSRAGTAGALLLATWNKKTKAFDFHGSVGSGGTYDDFAEIVSRLVPETVPPLKHDLSRAEERKVNWAIPLLVVKVKYQRWTVDGKLFHPSIQGISEDKTPKEAIRET
jgi:bifunctional non-homologous end joining protein LigD